MASKYGTQPVFNEYKAIACMCSYFSKSEDKCSFPIKGEALEAFDTKLSVYHHEKYIEGLHKL